MSNTGKTKLLCAVLIGTMVFSAFAIYVPGTQAEVIGVPEALDDIQPPMTEQVIESLGEPRSPEVSLNKIVSPLRDLVNTKGSSEVVITTNDIPELATILNRIDARKPVEDDEKGNGRFQLRTTGTPGKVVAQRVIIPNMALAEIADLQGVLAIEIPSTAETKEYNSPAVEEEKRLLDEWRTGLNERPETPIPASYGTINEVGAMQVWNDFGYNGTGVKVAVLDTGIDFAHPNLAGRWAVDDNPSSMYYGWPIMLHAGSLDLMTGLWTAGSDWDRYPYPVFASYGESSWYSDTSYQAQVDPSGYVLYQQGHNGQYTKRYNPDGYGGVVNMDRIDRNYFVGIPGNPGSVESASGWFHLGINKDDQLTAIHTERAGILVVDSTTPFEYDTVYVDLDNDLDFTDEVGCNKAQPLCYKDVNMDTFPDLSGGLLYYISDTMTSITGETVIASAVGDETSAALADGYVVSDIFGYDPYISSLLYQDGNYWPSATETIYQDLILSATGGETGTSVFLNDTSWNFNSGVSVDATWVLQNYDVSFIYAIENSTGSLTEGVDFDLNYSSGEITWLMDFTVGDYVYIFYQFDTWTIDFNTGDLAFIAPPIAGAAVTADYDTGLPFPYSVQFTTDNGYDNFIPASGDLVAFFGNFRTGAGSGDYHGTLVSTSLAGVPVGNVGGIFDIWGVAPGATIIGMDLFDYSPNLPLYEFAAHGYDSIPGTLDDAQIFTNSWGYTTLITSGFADDERFLWDLTTNYNPEMTIFFSAGNEGPGYGTIGTPGAGPGVITVGAGTNMNYRYLFGYDGSEGYYCWPLLGSGDKGCGPYGDVADFSSKGTTLLGTPEPDLFSVGAFALGGYPINYGFLQGWGMDGLNSWDLWSGTSLSAPVTAGVAALAYEAYKDANGVWPTSEYVRQVLLSTATDMHTDVLSQGAGWADAYGAVAAMMDTQGVISDTEKWVPGGYQGTHREGFVNFMEPGGSSDSTTITLTNLGSAAETVSVWDGVYTKSGEFNYVWDHPGSPWPAKDYLGILNTTGLWATDGTPILQQDISSLWNNADFMKVTVVRTPDDLTGTPYSYMELYDWYDTPHWEEGEFIAEAVIHNEDNETIAVGTFGETKAQTSSPSFGSYWFYLDGALMVDGLDYMYDPVTGWILLMNPLADGEVLTATYDWFEPVSSGDSFPMAIDSVVPGSVTAYLNGSAWDDNFGANWTVDFGNGVMWIWIDLQPGDVVEIEYQWDHAGVWDGALEHTRMMGLLPGGGANSVSGHLHQPATRIHQGLVISLRDVMGTGGPTPFIVEFFERANWAWMTDDSGGSVLIPAGGTASFTATMTVPGGTDPGSYQGAIYYEDSTGNVSTIPVLVNIAVSAFPAFFGGGMPVDSLYTNDGFIQGQIGARGTGDTRYFWVDLPTLEEGTHILENKKMIFNLYWQNTASDIEEYLFVQEDDPTWTDDAMWGPSTMTLEQYTKELGGVTDTIRGDAEYMGSDMVQGLIAMRYSAIMATGLVETFTSDVGYMQVDPIDLRISTNQLAGSRGATVTANVPLTDGIGAAVTEASSTLYAALPIDPYAYPGGSFSDYLYYAPNVHTTVVPAQTIQAKWSLFFYNGAADVDMGVFYDADCDGSYSVSDEVDSGHVASSANNPEVFSQQFPDPGCYMLHLAGYEVAPGSLGDLTFELSLIGAGLFSAENYDTTTIPPNTPSNFDIAWDLPGSTPEGAISSLIIVSPGHAPYALTQPITIDYRYDLTPPSILGFSPSEGATVSDSYYPITSAFQSIPGLDGDIVPGTGRIWVDNIEVTNLATETTAFDSDSDTPQDKYWLQSLAYEPAAPMEDGWHSVMASSTDTAGNTGTFSWSFIVDTTAPALSITSPASDMTTSATTIDVSGTAEPGATVTVSGLPASVMEDGSFTYVGLPLEDGANPVTVVATDAMGNTATAERLVVHDSAIPALSGLIVSPASRLTNLASATLSGTFDEMATLTIGGMVVPLNSDGTFMATVPLEEGANTIIIRAVDAAGNEFLKDDVVVTRDTVAPTLTVQLAGVDSDTGEAVDAEITVSGTATDNVGVKIVSVNGLSTVPDAGAFSKEFALSFGTNDITVTAVDDAGNSVTQSFSVSWTPENIVKKQTYTTLILIVLAVVLLIIGLLIGFFAARGPSVMEEEEYPDEEMPEEAPEEVVVEEEEIVEEPMEEEALEEIDMPEETPEEPGEEPLEEVRPPEGGGL
jgi:hypothetical protein